MFWFFQSFWVSRLVYYYVTDISYMPSYVNWGSSGRSSGHRPSGPYPHLSERKLIQNPFIDSSYYHYIL